MQGVAGADTGQPASFAQTDVPDPGSIVAGPAGLDAGAKPAAPPAAPS